MSDHTDMPTYTRCDTCLAIRRSRRESQHEYWLDHLYFKPLSEVVPQDVLMDADMEMLHVNHHAPDTLRDAPIFVGFRVILNHFLTADVVPREEMRAALAAQYERYAADIDATKQAARQEVIDRNGEEMRELRVRVVNVEALITVAFRAKRKTMSYADVRAALDWRTGDPLPEITRQRVAELNELAGRAPGARVPAPVRCAEVNP